MVKRYGADGFQPGVIEVECGDLVHYDDYKALQAENERLKAGRVDLEQFRAFLNQTLGCIEDWAHQELGYTDGLAETDGGIDQLGDEADRLLALIDAHKGE